MGNALVYTLRGDAIDIMLAVEPGGAVGQLRYRPDDGEPLEFSGDAISSAVTAEGIRLTVVLADGAADGPIVRFSVLLPAVETWHDGPFDVTAASVRTTQRSLSGGVHPGPQQSFDAMTLLGTAEMVADLGEDADVDASVAVPSDDHADTEPEGEEPGEDEGGEDEPPEVGQTDDGEDEAREPEDGDGGEAEASEGGGEALAEDEAGGGDGAEAEAGDDADAAAPAHEGGEEPADGYDADAVSDEPVDEGEESEDGDAPEAETPTDGAEVEASEDGDDDAAVEAPEDGEDELAVEAPEDGEDELEVEAPEDGEDELEVEAPEDGDDDAEVEAPEDGDDDTEVEASEDGDDDMEVEAPAGPADDRVAGECRDLHAVYDEESPGPSKLVVTGLCTMPTPVHRVELRPADPQGINPYVLLLDTIVGAPDDPGPAALTDVALRYENETEFLYDKVKIQPDGPTVAVIYAE